MNKRYQEALSRATNPTSQTNIATVYAAAEALGLHDAEPGTNVLTFAAWKALGRYVRKGEKAMCQLVTFIPIHKKNDQGDKEKIGTRCKKVAVFHFSQTEAKD